MDFKWKRAEEEVEIARMLEKQARETETYLKQTRRVLADKKAQNQSIAAWTVSSLLGAKKASCEATKKISAGVDQYTQTEEDNHSPELNDEETLWSLLLSPHDDTRISMSHHMDNLRRALQEQEDLAIGLEGERSLLRASVDHARTRDSSDE